jgi:drug/metabolite transporter (DMT)-like permease
MNNQKLINWGLFVLLSLIWGSSFILMKVSKEHLNGYQIGAVRIFSAGLVFFPFALFHLFKIPKRKIPIVILSGLLGNLFPAFLFAVAIENRIDSSLAGILNSLTPLFVIVISMVAFKAVVPKRKLIGVLIGFVGLLLLSLSKGGISLTNAGYASLILVATIMYGLNVNVVTQYLKGIDPFHMATVSLAFMSLIAGVVLWQQDMISIALYDDGARVSILYAVLLGVVGSAIATLLFYMLIKQAGGLFASLVTYAIPIVAIFWGIVAKENVTLIQISCLAVILGGVYLTNKA